MRTVVTVVVMCLFPAFAVADWQRIVCIDDPSLTVTLLLKPVATAADEDFVGWELNNRTDQPLKVTNVLYQLRDVKKSDRATGKAISDGSMAQGNDYDLFWRDGRPAPLRRETTIAPGVSRYMRYCSLYSLGVIGLPEAGAWTLNGRAIFNISLAGNKHLATPMTGVPFKFDLLAPDDQTRAAMVKQLKGVLEKPNEAFGDGHILRTTLAYEPVASAVDLADLLAGLKRMDQIIGRSIIERIDRLHPTDDATIDFWIDAVNRDDFNLLRDLEIAQNVRSPRLVGPLVECIERGRQSAPYFALRMLHRQRSVMPDQAAVAARIGPVVLKRAPWLEKGEMDLDKRGNWQEQMADLALTGDPAMIKYFLPYLDNKTVAIPAKMVALANNGVDTRVCDVAYNNLLILLNKADKPFTMMFEGNGLRTFRPLDAAEEHARRDELIAKLKKDLPAAE